MFLFGKSNNNTCFTAFRVFRVYDLFGLVFKQIKTELTNDFFSKFSGNSVGLKPTTVHV